MSDDNNNNENYLHLYEQIENLKLDLARTRENARKWHRKAQGIDKVIAENEWLRSTLRTIRSKHEFYRNNQREGFRYKISRHRAYQRDLDQLIIDNLNDKLLGDTYLFMDVIETAANGREYYMRKEVVHPKDHSEVEQSEIMINSTIRASPRILILRLMRERNIAIDKYKKLKKFKMLQKLIDKFL